MKKNILKKAKTSMEIMEISRFLISLPEDEKNFVLKQVGQDFNRNERRSFEKLYTDAKLLYIINSKNGIRELIKEFDKLYVSQDDNINTLSYEELVGSITEDNSSQWNKYTIHIIYKCYSNIEVNKEQLIKFIRSDIFRSVVNGKWTESSSEEEVYEEPEDIDDEASEQTVSEEEVPAESVTVEDHDTFTFMGYIELRKTYFNFNAQYICENGSFRELSKGEREKLFPYYGWLNLGIVPYRSSQSFMENLNIDVSSDTEVKCTSIFVVDFFRGELLDNVHQNILKKLDLQLMTDNGVKLRDRIKPIEAVKIYRIATPENPLVSSEDYSSTMIFINEDYPANTRVMLLNDDVFYGPVVVRENKNSGRKYIKFDSTVLDGYRVSENPVMSIEKQDDMKNLDPVVIRMVQLKKASVRKDILTDSKLLESVKASVDMKSVFTDPAAFLAECKKSTYMNNIDDSIRNDRLKRIEQLLTHSANISSTGDDIVNYILNDPKQFEVLLGDRINELPAFAAVSAELEGVKRQAAQLAEENRQLTEQKSKKKHLSAQERVMQSIDELRTEKNQLSHEINLLTERRRELIKIDSLAQEIDRLTAEKENIASEINTLSASEASLREKIKTALSEEVNEARIAFDPYISNEMLNAAEKWRTADDGLIYRTAAESISRVTPSRYSLKELADKLVYDVQQFRNYSKNDIINMYICIAQSFMTVFSGDPGTGKTSACCILAASLGLNNFQGLSGYNTNRFVSVSVEKGWTSKRDLIGYYNPLTRNYDRSNSKLYDALMTLDAEGKNSAYPFMVLLDEANLSPVEYYWADFMKLTDKLTDEAYINIGLKKELFVPETLRFLATVNNDRTTEQLSPRLIDRAWIVRLPDVEELKEDVPDIMEYFSGEHILWVDFINAFGPRKNTGKFTLTGTVNEIFRIFGECGVHISARVRIAVKNYLETASTLMENTEYCSADEAALDRIIVQKLFPKLNGYYEDYKPLFDRLDSIAAANHLILTKKAAADMIKRSERNMGYCQYLV